jgi:hypothetical protein
MKLLGLKSRNNKIAVAGIGVFTVWYTLSFIVLPNLYDTFYCHERCSEVAAKTYCSFCTGTNIEFVALRDNCNMTSSNNCAIVYKCRWDDSSCKSFGNTEKPIPRPDSDLIVLGLYLIAATIIIYCIKEGEHENEKTSAGPV